MSAKLVNPLKQKLASGGVCVGAMLTMPSPGLTQLFSASGFDWVLIDMEHGPIGPESMQAMINATACGDPGSQAVPLVRIPHTATWQPKTALDAGALGLFFPMVADQQNAADAVRSATYPPTGKRGFGPFYASSRWGMSRMEYAAAADQALLKVIMVETAEGIDNVEEIANTEGVDVVFIAPFDLSQSLGCPGDIEHPDYINAVAKAEKEILLSPAKLGGFAAIPLTGKQMIATGYQFLMLGYDGLIIETAIGSLLKQLSD